MTAKSARWEDGAQIGILLLVGSMAGAASFTHVHDWTMANSPAGTGDWFGWANAVISELTPTAVALEIRRRKRTGAAIGYPLAVLVASAALSIGAQLAVAKPGATGGLVAAIPALAFLALTKLVFSRPVAVPEQGPVPVPVPTVPAPVPADLSRVTQTGTQGGGIRPELEAPVQAPAAAVKPPAPVPASVPAAHDEIKELLPAARDAASALLSDGQSLTRAALANRMRGSGVAVANRKLGPLLTVLKTEGAAV
ncbi:hypothetical protein [Actinocorallia longicatena]|uniref:DUF2637 domain-containing protein n=1 Tax=Actinocorallia longicatena TaxID=111803 RepID=A0ABP6QBG3_9ACTN